MGHYLKTQNPEAAEAIGSKLAFPPVGTMVQFFPRPGEHRMGRFVFPAMVIATREHENVDQMRVDLLVFFGQEDTGERTAVPRRTMDHDYPAWNFVEKQAAAPSYDDLLDQINDLDSALQSLLADNKALHDRLKALETKRGPGRPRLSEEEAA